MSSQSSNNRNRRRWLSSKAISSPLSTSSSTVVPIMSSVRNNDNHSDNDVSLKVEEVQRRAMIREHLSMISDDIVIRFFRRSFFYALVVEDRNMAYQCYTATRLDFENHFISMVCYPNKLPRRGQNGFHNVKRRTNMDSPSSIIKEYATQFKGAQSGDTTNGLLQRFMNPSDPFEIDDFYDPYDDAYGEMDEWDDNGNPCPNFVIANLIADALFLNDKDMTAKSRFLNHASSRHKHNTVISRNMNDSSSAAPRINNHIPVIDDILITTPIHEVARLGHVALLKRILRHSNVDYDARNGCGRTILHCAAGGLASYESENEMITTIDADTGMSISRVGNGSDMDAEVFAYPVGIRAPRYPIEKLDIDSRKERSLTQRTKSLFSNAARAVTIRWSPRLSSNTSNVSTVSKDLPLFGQTLSDSDNSPLKRGDRIEIVLAILNWKEKSSTTIDDDVEEVFTDDTTPSFTLYDHSTGVSINAVDTALNRTALHYAAELGRTEICESILSFSYAAMLTIVDTFGRTPCELAALRSHRSLSSYLEARALLYVDPYGTEEDLLNTVSMAANNHNDVEFYRNLEAPFCCFETNTLSVVDKQREQIVQNVMDLMHLILSDFVEHQDAASDAKAVQVKMDTAASDCANELEPASTNEEIFFDTAFDIDTTVNRDDDPNDAKMDHKEKYPYSSKEWNFFQIGIHEGHIEKYLTFHHWIVADAMVAFKNNPFASFQAAQVPTPNRLLPVDISIDKPEQLSQDVCLICCDEFDSNVDKWKQLSTCDHGFCTECLDDYFLTSTSSGFVIECPHHSCNSLLSRQDILDVAPPESSTYNRLHHSAIDTFIVSSNSYAYCPYPGCGDNTAIHVLLPKRLLDAGVFKFIGAVCTNVDKVDIIADSAEVSDKNDRPPIVTYEGVHDSLHYNIVDMVQPKLAHRFCFQCGDKRIHWPVTCSRLQEWKSTIVEQVGEDVHDSAASRSDATTNFNDVAHNLWMKANTRPCPKVSILSPLKI
jgi:Ankyrin repeats (many copies)